MDRNELTGRSTGGPSILKFGIFIADYRQRPADPAPFPYKPKIEY